MQYITGGWGLGDESRQSHDYRRLALDLRSALTILQGSLGGGLFAGFSQPRTLITRHVE